MQSFIDASSSDTGLGATSWLVPKLSGVVDTYAGVSGVWSRITSYCLHYKYFLRTTYISTIGCEASGKNPSCVVISFLSRLETLFVPH